MKEILQRINELARKEALSPEEIQERDALRRAYLQVFRGQLKSNLATVSIYDSEGNDVTPAKLRAAQRDGSLQLEEAQA